MLYILKVESSSYKTETQNVSIKIVKGIVNVSFQLEKLQYHILKLHQQEYNNLINHYFLKSVDRTVRETLFYDVSLLKS